MTVHPSSGSDVSDRLLLKQTEQDFHVFDIPTDVTVGVGQSSFIGCVAASQVVAKPREVVNGALFLASDESSYVNGTSFLVDGGLTAAYVTPE